VNTRVVAVVLAVVGALVAAGAALGVQEEIPSSYDTLVLEAEGGAEFDVTQPPDQYNDDCALGDLGGPVAEDLGYSPATDTRSDDGYSDAFDGGLVLWVRSKSGRTVFEDSNQMGLLRDANFLKTGPEKLRGLTVTRTEQTLQVAPALRSLIKLKNPKRKPVSRTIIWDSDLGADESEVVLASATADKQLSAADRWMVFGDDEESPGDNVGTFVLYGKRAAKETGVFNPVTDQDSCVSFRIQVRVPAKSSRYVLFFTETHDPDEEGVAAARQDAKRYNDRNLGRVELKGIRAGVRKKILNWDLG